MAATHVYAGAGKYRGGSRWGIFRFEPGQARAEQLTNGLPERVSVHCITVHPNDPDLVFIGAEDGLYVSSDRGAHWQKPELPDKGIQIWSILVHPGAPRTILAGAAPVGVYRSEDGGERWRKIAQPTIPERVKMGFPCRVMRLALDPAKPADVFATVEVNGVMRSRDGGASWSDCSAGLIGLAGNEHYKSRIGSDTDAEGMLDGHAVCVSTADPGAVYLACRMGIFRSGDGGESWRDLEVGRFSPLTYARDVRPAPQDPKTLYACLSVHSTGETGSLARSRDLGASWERIDHGVHPKGTFMYMALNPRDAGQVWGVTRPGQVIGTMDGGKSWNETQLPDGCGDCYCVACG
jgi:photosystem II stability/assembly factor-like uncharacterized protein